MIVTSTEAFGGTETKKKTGRSKKKRPRKPRVKKNSTERENNLRPVVYGGDHQEMRRNASSCIDGRNHRGAKSLCSEKDEKDQRDGVILGEKQLKLNSSINNQQKEERRGVERGVEQQNKEKQDALSRKQRHHTGAREDTPRKEKKCS